MALIQDGVTSARHEASASLKEVPDSVIMEMINTYYEEDYNAFVQTDSDIFFGRRKYNLVANQQEYFMILPDDTRETAKFGIGTIESVAIKTTASGSYIPCTRKTMSQLKNGQDRYFERYSINQPSSNPIYVHIKHHDKDSIMLFPGPLADITNGLDISGYLRPYYLDINDDDADVLMPYDKAKKRTLIKIYALIAIAEKRKQFNLAERYKNDRDAFVRSYIQDLSIGEVGCLEQDAPDLSSFV